MHSIQGMEEAQDKQKEYKEIEHRWNVKAAEDEQEDQGNSKAVSGQIFLNHNESHITFSSRRFAIAVKVELSWCLRARHGTTWHDMARHGTTWHDMAA
jgi:hypothetical protein